MPATTRPLPPPSDPVALASALIARPSVTPADAGALAVLQDALEPLGFICRSMPFGEIRNLYAKRPAGAGAPNLCFAGHTDVVPPGDSSLWRDDPFRPVVRDGVLYGRGAADMKAAIAAWVCAVARVLQSGGAVPTLSLLITGDEEGPALDGTRRVVEQLAGEGERIDHCVVGEPTSVLAVGDMVKVGRRGSINAWIEAEGRQGHVAYPDRAANPIPVLIDLLARLKARRLDEGWPHFPASNLEVTTVDVGNPATNVIPQTASARLNVRFNPAHTGAGLADWFEAEARAAEAAAPGVVLRVSSACSGEAFLTEGGAFVDLVGEAVEQAVGRKPEPSTSGGTSDARFIRALCPVVELGLVGATMHQADESAPVADIAALTDIYAALIVRYGQAFGSGSPG